jgi:hypothetical protein
VPFVAANPRHFTCCTASPARNVSVIIGGPTDLAVCASRSPQRSYTAARRQRLALCKRQFQAPPVQFESCNHDSSVFCIESQTVSCPSVATKLRRCGISFPLCGEFFQLAGDDVVFERLVQKRISSSAPPSFQTLQYSGTTLQTIVKWERHINLQKGWSKAGARVRIDSSRGTESRYRLQVSGGGRQDLCGLFPAGAAPHQQPARGLFPCSHLESNTIPRGSRTRVGGQQTARTSPWSAVAMARNSRCDEGSQM